MFNDYTLRVYTLRVYTLRVYTLRVYTLRVQALRVYRRILEAFGFCLSFLETRFLHMVSFGNNFDIQEPLCFFHISG